MTVDFEPEVVYKDIEDSLERMQAKLGISKKQDSKAFQKERDQITRELQEARNPNKSSYDVSPTRNRRLTQSEMGIQQEPLREQTEAQKLMLSILQGLQKQAEYE